MKIMAGRCVRCGSNPAFILDMGELGFIPLCPICWTGLSTCLEKDIKVWRQAKDWMPPFQAAFENQLEMDRVMAAQERLMSIDK